MALQGTIDTFELTEVVRLLAAGRKTGVLRLEGSRGAGRLWVSEGRVTAVEVDHAPRTEGPAEAMFELLRFTDGSFTFAPDEHADPEGEPADVEEILVDAEAQLAEWREIEAVVPSTRATVTLRPELPKADVVLDRQRWSMVAAIGGGVTVATLGDAFDLGELPVSRAVKELIELGVVDLGATPADEPVAEPVVEAETVDVEPVEEPAAVVLEAETVEAAIEPEPESEPTPSPIVLDLPEPEPFVVEADSARAQLDEFAAGFGLSDDAPAFESAVEAPAADADNGFTDFGSENGGGLLDESPFETSDGDQLSDFSSFSFEPPAEEQDRDPFAEVANLGMGQPAPFLAGGNDAAEVARQLSNLSPAAARAVAAAAKATTDEEREAALAAVAQEGEEPIDRELLLRFLASVKS
ncbi:MAG TPA: DUF4388 domain-containing protein [Acidimicrobiales bacterium]|nr:DUF4388 domain-containing protein [Acidimicrobiales bacterium]